MINKDESPHQREMEKYDFSYTIKTAVRVINTKKESSLFKE